MIAEKYEGEYDIYHAKSCAGDIAAQLGAEPLGEKGWTDEQIVEANPEAIFSVHVSSVTDEEAVNLFLDNPALASVDAVKNGRVYPVEYGLAYTPGVRTGLTVKMFQVLVVAYLPRRGFALRTFAFLFSYNSARGLPLGNNNIPQAAGVRLRKAEMQTVGLTVRRCAVLF